VADGILVEGEAAPALLRNLLRENGGHGLAYAEKGRGVARENVLQANEAAGVRRPRGCRAELDAQTLGEPDALTQAFERLGSRLAPGADRAEVAADLATILAHAPHGQDLRSWFQDRLRP